MRKLQGLLFVAASAFLFGMAASAQQQPSPLEQALGAKLTTEVGAGLQCSVDLITTRSALDKALARIKELETKLPESVPPQ